jgi:CubicO group peptidase (beta-lactamase class C family)
MFTHLSRESSEQLIGFICRPLAERPANSVADWPQVSLPEPAVIKEIERHADGAFKNDTFSGAILIARNDQVLLNKAYGMADQKNGIPNRTDTKFNLGSMNKMFTSVAIAQLAQAGKLSYDDTLAHVLPDYPNQTAARKITIMELLTHTAGLGDFFKPEFFEQPDDYVSLRDYLPLFARERLLFEPGAGWSYSNAGYIVLGLVIEKVSGENYFDYVRNHVFQPAGMTNTDSFERNTVVPNLALGYAADDNDPDHKTPRQANTTSLPLKGSSAGGGYSTTDDLLRFSQALLNYRLLDEATTSMIMTGRVDDHHMNSKYGCGFIDMTRFGQHIVGHNGGGPGISGAMYMLKDSGYVVIVLGNYSPPSADELAREISEFLARQSSQNVKLAMAERR